MSPRRFALQILWRSGLASIARVVLNRDRRLAVSFHGIAARHYPELDRALLPSFTASELHATLSWIGRRFAFLTSEEFLTGSKPGVLLTFDDGYANHAENALPVLEAHGAPAVFFVTVQHVLEPHDWLPATRDRVGDAEIPERISHDLYDGMNREQLHLCARHPLIEIGAHTMHHPFLTRCDDGALASELANSKRLLEQHGGCEVTLFAYPSGDYDLRVAEAVRDGGYRAAFAEIPASVGLAAYEVPRVGLYTGDPAYLAAKLSGLHQRALPLECTL